MTSDAYLPGFSADVFITYSHLDNHHIDSKGTLWVDHFHRELQGLINACVGHPVRVWRDPRLSGASVFSDEIAGRLRKTAILIAIVSPGYIDSAWCQREREIFIESASDSGGLDVGTSRRIISAIKLPVPLDTLPDALKSALGFPLYSIDEQSGKISDYLFDPRPEAERLYRRTLSDLAQAIADLLKMMRHGRSSRVSKSAGARPTVYLAETTSDLERERERLRMELEARGCVVLPRQPLPHQLEPYTKSARADLARSDLSFHLLGRRYGLIPEGGAQSLVELQTELAAERIGSGLKSVVWIPRNLERLEPQQSTFLERIRTQNTTGIGFELLETSFEDLTTFLIDLVEGPAAPDPASISQSAIGAPAVQQIYVIRDREDRENVGTLRRFLFDQGFEVITPADEGEEGLLRENHQENLKVCDGVMIWWGNTKKIWLDYMMRDLDRARGLGRTIPFLATAVCIAAPSAPEKDDFMTHKASVLRFVTGFEPEALAPLLESMKSAGHA